MMIQVNEERIKREFAELTAIDSLSYGERRMADRLTEKLKELGFQVEEDDAAGTLKTERELFQMQSGDSEKPSAVQGQERNLPAGNLYGFLKGTLPGTPILLLAHMDTVRPGYGKKAVFHEDGRITGSGDTVLGADDAAGLVEILEGIRCMQEMGLAHRDIEILFPAAEEVHCRGSAVFDYSRIRAKEAYVFDLSGPVGTAAVQAPSILTFEATMIGKAAHAGFAPEDGIHAIAAMCEAVSRISQGRSAAGTEKETTLNIGSIHGGMATNVVPAACSCIGEIRSCSHAHAMEMAEYVREIFENTAAQRGAECEVNFRVNITAYKTDTKEAVVRRFQKVCEGLSLPGNLITTFGGSDNNNLAQHGISGIVVSCGMCDVHSVRESVRVEDLVTGARLAAGLLSIDELSII
ncbi:MAG: M20/M25/M40 family metallo-hydrolase [Lachnospiraceae bacterium]|nr:M20/M25/M40 family metallo-hydrolase [Lachnospiraceae bacterium]